MVEFSKRDGVLSVFESAAIPNLPHEAAVPFKSRLLSLKTSNSSDLASSQPSVKVLSQTAIPIDELVRRLSKEDSVSVCARSGWTWGGSVYLCCFFFFAIIKST